MTKKANIWKKRLGFVSTIVLIANVLTIFALLISYSAAYINPKTFWPIAFFGLGYLPLLILNIGFVLYWLMRKPKLMFLSLTPILLGWNLMTQHITYSVQDEADSVESIRVMSYNAHLFQPAKNIYADVKSEVIDIISYEKPDVLCFQEFQSKLRGKNRMTELVKEKGGLEYLYFVPASENKHDAYGQAIFSKYPIINSGMISKNEYGVNRIIYADILKDEDTIRIYNVHLRTFALQSEDKEFIQNPSSTAEDDKKISKRVGRKLKGAFTHRSNQAQSLHDHIRETTLPLIVMGDFNDTPMSYSVNLISENLKNAFQEKGSGWGVTHYEMLPIFQIDYVFCSNQFDVNSYHIIKKKLSDHYPIASTLTLRN